MTTDNQPISAVQAAALLLALLPELARAETYPQWSDGTGEPRRGQRVTLYDAAGDILGADRDEHRSVLRVLLRVEGGDWDRPQTFSVAGESLSLTYPVVPSLPAPLWLSPLAEPDPARDCPASLAAGLMDPPDWSDGCEPEFVERPTVDVPVAGEAL